MLEFVLFLPARGVFVFPGKGGGVWRTTAPGRERRKALEIIQFVPMERLGLDTRCHRCRISRLWGSFARRDRGIVQIEFRTRDGKSISRE